MSDMNVYEAINWLKTKCYVESPQDETFDECVEVIEKTLLELKAIKEAKPNEALEEIGNVDLGDNPYKTFDTNKLKNVYNKEFNGIKQALLKAEKLEKVLDIIRTKMVNVGKFIDLVGEFGFTYEEAKINDERRWFNICYCDDFLTPEEFELLKEVLI